MTSRVVRSRPEPLDRRWWKEAVVYQIYPRSFCDSDGDGVGDLRGITAKLDHLALLGVDVVWLSPIYASPNDDNGYDISDYRAIMAEFGTMADFDEMLAAMHARGIKLMMDLVVNHSSDEHAWFVESSSSTDNPYRDYYIWRPPSPADAPDATERQGLPNNWTSFFSGPAWKLDERTGEYVLHLFSTKQPDLNWENPVVRGEVWDLMRFWLDKGIDGFRMDVINLISKVPGLPDAPVRQPGFLQPAERMAANGPRLLEFLGEMRSKVLSQYDIITVGETPMVTPVEGAALTNESTGPLDMVFQFEHMGLDSHGSKWDLKPLDLRDLKQVMSRWQTELDGKGWNSLYLSNHDQPRPVSRWGGDGRYRVESAKMLATWLHLQQGTPYIYQGEELGMTNVRFASIDSYRDIETLNMYREATSDGRRSEDVMTSIYVKGRDNARTPMQWDASTHAGFTSGSPWIAVNPNFRSVNAAAAIADPASVFHYYRRLIELRKANPVMVYGHYALLQPDDTEVYAYTRTLSGGVDGAPGDRLLVVCNFTAGTPTFALPADVAGKAGEILISNYDVPAQADPVSIALRPYEAIVWWLH